MMEVLRKKLQRLAHDEEGVALVVTLALFMFLYVSCAGVFSVGQAVKERIILQNAVDAAAYSAAMIEADTLSRIATINRAMAWTYKALVCSQMDWIALKTLSKTHNDYVLDDAPQASRIGCDSSGMTSPLPGTPLGLSNTVSIDAGTRPRTTPFESRLASDLARMPDDADALETKIGEYSLALEEMNEAIEDLKSGMRQKIKDTISDVLKANLPTRIGDLCRWEMKVADVADLFKEMSAADEEMFVAFANETIEDFSDQDWFTLQGDSSFMRMFVGALKTRWSWQEKTFPYAIHDEEVTADGFRPGGKYGEDFPEAFEGYRAKPQVLVPEYFPIDETSISRGAITVAVAKKNENPWGRLTDGKGIYAAFDHALATDWSMAIASAQAGYRDVSYEEDDDDDMKKRPAYSLRPVKYEDWDKSKVYWNLATPDWNAVFLPVRKAFKRGSDADSLKEWMKDGTWDRLVDTPKYVSSLQPFSNVNQQALPNMHNNGGSNSVLNWGADEFLDLFYH